MKQQVYFLTLLLGLIHSIALGQSVQVRGQVVDEFGYPLAGAEVFLSPSSLGAQTDESGRFEISNVAPGSYNLSVRYLGFQPQTLYNILVKSKGNPSYTLVMIEESLQLEGVELSALATVSRSRETPISTQTLSAVEIATYPGGNNDVLQVAQTLPGVSPSVGGFRNDLIIRGGAPNESVYYLDGIEIPNLNHFSTQGSSGGPVGMINVSFIENVTLSTSAFGAQYDNPLSGVLQFKQRNGSSQGWNRNIRVSASETAFTIEGPIASRKEGKTTFIGSVRRSYLQFLFDLIGLPFRPSYWDYQYKIHHPIDQYNSLDVIGIGAIDDFTLEPPSKIDSKAQAQLEQAPFIDQQTHVLGVSWTRRMREGNGLFTLNLSHNRLDNSFNRYQNAENQEGVLFSNQSLEAETKLRTQLTQYLGKTRWTMGANLQRSTYTNTTLYPTESIEYSTSIGFYKYGLFSSLSGDLSRKIAYSVGFRLDDDSFTSQTRLIDQFSPRGSITYKWNENLSASFSAGRYHKIPTYTQLGFQREGDWVNRDLRYIQSDHLGLGIQKYLNSSTLFSVEGFYKRYLNYPVSIRDEVSLANKGAGFEVLGNEEVNDMGKGRTYGIELLLRQKLSNRLYGLLSYTLFKSEFSGIDSTQYLRSTWDSRHLASFTGGYKLDRNWEISSRFRFAGKTPFAPIDADYSLVNYPDLRLNYSELGNPQYLLDSFSQLDIRLDKKWNFSTSSFNLFIEIQNLFSNTLPTPPEYGLASDPDGTLLTPLQLSEIPQTEGQFIPSIGLVFDF